MSHGWTEGASAGLQGILKNSFVAGPLFRFVPVLFAFPLFFGSARPWFWGAGLAYFILVSTWSKETWADHGLVIELKQAKADVFFRLFCILSCWMLVQVIPLPDPLLKVLSPSRYELIVATRELIFDGAGGWLWSSISYAPVESIMALLRWLGYGFTVFVFYNLSAERIFRRHFVSLVFVLCAMEAFYGLLQVLVPSMGVLWDTSSVEGLAYSGTARGTFINRNHFAAFLNLCWPFLLGNLIADMEKKNLKRVPSFLENHLFRLFILGLILLSLLFSQSRAGIVTALVGATVFIFLAGLRSRKLWISVGLCWVLVGLYGAVIGFQDIVARFERATQDVTGRMAIWSTAWAMIKQHWATGTGWGSYFFIEGLFRVGLPDVRRAGHAHCDYLEWAAELGIPMASVMVLLLWGLWLSGAIALLRRRRHLRRVLVLRISGMLAGIFAVQVHAWVDFPFQIPAIFFYFAVFTGLWLRYQNFFNGFRRNEVVHG